MQLPQPYFYTDLHIVLMLGYKKVTIMWLVSQVYTYYKKNLSVAQMCFSLTLCTQDYCIMICMYFMEKSMKPHKVRASRLLLGQSFSLGLLESHCRRAVWNWVIWTPRVHIMQPQVAFCLVNTNLELVGWKAYSVLKSESPLKCASLHHLDTLFRSWQISQ